MTFLTTIGLLALGGAFAQATPEGSAASAPAARGALADDAPAPPPPESSFESALARAKARYFSGEVEEAAIILDDLWRRLQGGETPTPEARREALIYLYEIRFKQDALQVAEAVLLWLFEVDPDATISPFRHPVEVVEFFKTVQRRGRPRQTIVIPDRGPPPVWTFLPLGLPQASQGRTGAAVAYGGLQVAFATASIGLYVHLTRLQRGDGLPDGLTTAEQRQRVRFRTYALQWPTAALFYATWGLSVNDGLRRWRRDRPSPSEQLGVEVVPMGPGLTPGVTLTLRPGAPRRPPSDPGPR